MCDMINPFAGDGDEKIGFNRETVGTTTKTRRRRLLKMLCVKQIHVSKTETSNISRERSRVYRKLNRLDIKTVVLSESQETLHLDK